MRNPADNSASRQGPRQDNSGRHHKGTGNAYTKRANAGNEDQAPRFREFEDYLEQADIEAGLASGKMITGKVRINTKNFEQAFIPGGKTFPRDVGVVGLQDRNRALEGDTVVAMLKDKADWKILEKDAIQDGCRIRRWIPAAPPNSNTISGPGPPADEELTVRARGFSIHTDAETVAGVFAQVGVLPAWVRVHHGTVDIKCPDELAARLLMKRTGTKHRSEKVELFRGDGTYLDLDDIAPQYVQPIAKVVAITKSNPSRLFAGVVKPFGKAKAPADKKGLFISKDYRVPRIIVPWTDMVRSPALVCPPLHPHSTTPTPPWAGGGTLQFFFIDGKAWDVHMTRLRVRP